MNEFFDGRIKILFSQRKFFNFEYKIGKQLRKRRNKEKKDVDEKKLMICSKNMKSKVVIVHQQVSQSLEMVQQR